MKKILVSALVAVTALSTLTFAGGDVTPIEVAQVQTTKDFYVGGALTASQVYQNGQADWFNDTDVAETGYGAGVQAGYVFFRSGDFSTAIEARANKTFWELGDDVEDAEILSYSALIKPQYNFGDFGVYGLAGYGASKITTVAYSERQNGFVYGAGAEYLVTDSIAIFADYVVNPAFTEEGFTDVENDTISLGVNYKF